MEEGHNERRLSAALRALAADEAQAVPSAGVELRLRGEVRAVARARRAAYAKLSMMAVALVAVVSGLVCALAGIVFTARLANARANNALGFELDVITIALLGGVSVFGGRGKLTGVLWALVLVATLRNVLGLRQVGGDAQGIAIGLLLIGALLLGNSAERPFDRIRTRRMLGAGLTLDQPSTSGSGRP